MKVMVGVSLVLCLACAGAGVEPEEPGVVEPATEIPTALQPLLGAWLEEQAGLRVVVTPGSDNVPGISVYSYSEAQEFPAQSPILSPDGTLKFSTVFEGQSIYWTLALLDGNTLSAEVTIDGRSSKRTMTRSAHPEGLSHPTEVERFVARQADVEIPGNIEGIKTAQLAYDASFDQFVAAQSWPRAPELLTQEAMLWPSGSSFDTIGWAPDGKVYGSYSVEVNHAGTDFTVHGWIDADGDGQPAHWSVTKRGRARRTTPEGVR